MKFLLPILTIFNILAFDALAQNAEAPAMGAGPTTGNLLMPLLFVVVIFYFLVFRPESKKAKQRVQMIEALRRGDKVVTTGGIEGKIVKVENDGILIVEIAENVQVRLRKGMVVEIISRATPANDDTVVEKPSKKAAKKK